MSLCFECHYEQEPRIDPAEIANQRAKGWPEFHPEDFCHQCGRRFEPWFSPEFDEVRGDDEATALAWTIVCPTCYVNRAVEVTGERSWTITKSPTERESAGEAGCDGSVSGRSVSVAVSICVLCADGVGCPEHDPSEVPEGALSSMLAVLDRVTPLRGLDAQFGADDERDMSVRISHGSWQLMGEPDQLTVQVWGGDQRNPNPPLDKQAWT